MAKFKFLIASAALPFLAATHTTDKFKLKYRFLSFLIAVGTQAMRWLSVCCLLLQNISKRIPTKIGQSIPLLLSFPIFKANHLVFKFTYVLNQRRLRLLCGEDFFLKFYDRRVATGGVVDILQSLRYIKSGLNSAQASERFSHYHDVFPNVCASE